MTPTDDATAFISSVLREVLFGSEDEHPLSETIDRYFAPDFVLHAKGETVDRNQFIAGAEQGRQGVSSGDITMLDLVRDGHRFAERHITSRTDAGGEVSRKEVWMFVELDEQGLIRRIDELSRPLD